MPLKKGSSKEKIAYNIEEMLKAYKETGKIGNTTPKNMEHARKIASAAAYKKAGKSKNKKKFKNFLESLVNEENAGIIETLNKGFYVCMESISPEDARRIAFDLADENTPELHLLAETGTINNKEALAEEIEGTLNALIIAEIDPMEKESMENELLDLQDFVSNTSNVMESHECEEFKDMPN